MLTSGPRRTIACFIRNNQNCEYIHRSLALHLSVDIEHEYTLFRSNPGLLPPVESLHCVDMLSAATFQQFGVWELFVMVNNLDWVSCPSHL